MYLLDRLILIAGSLTASYLVLAAFHSRLKSSKRLWTFLIVILAQIPVSFGPDVLFQGSISSRFLFTFENYRHVDVVSNGGYLYSLEVKTETSEDGDLSWTHSNLTIFHSSWIGYDIFGDGEELTYLYDDLQGERKLIFFHWHVREDGSTFLLVANSLEDPLTSLVIEGHTMELLYLDDPDYAYVVLPPERPFDCFSDSILFNGVEIGDLLRD